MGSDVAQWDALDEEWKDHSVEHCKELCRHFGTLAEEQSTGEVVSSQPVTMGGTRYLY